MATMYFAAVANGIYTSALIVLLLYYCVTNCHNLSDLTQTYHLPVL